MADTQKGNLWERSGWTLRIAVVMLTLICVRAVINPVTHRLSPDIGTAEDESNREGQVVGFHYERASWWGFRKKTYDSIRFVAGRGPQYLDEDTGKWRDVPPEAWGIGAELDERAMDVDNRGWHEQ